MADEVKHDGCHDCGSKDEPVLQSVLVIRERIGFALCSKCVEKRAEKREIVR